MAITRNISLSEEMSKRLKSEDNASELIDSLLKEHYKKTDFSKMTLKDKIKLREKLIAQKDFKAKMEKIEND